MRNNFERQAVGRRYLAVLGLALLAACTAGGIPTSTGGGGGGVTIDVNLTTSNPTSTPYGTSLGYSPAVTTVPVGTQITFTNTDSFNHTATSIPNAQQFPSGSPFGDSALTQHGNTLSGGFSSGALLAGLSSQTVTADRPGTYLFGCFFHYGGGMRGAIVAQ